MVRAVIEVKITPERGGGFDRLAERIAKYAEVRSCYLMSGSYDLLVVVEGNNLRELASFVSEKLATIQGVLSTATHFMLKPYKEQGVLMVHERDEDGCRLRPKSFGQGAIERRQEQPMLSSVSSPMFERRKVVPLIFP
jgi:hypothetical protein